VILGGHLWCSPYEGGSNCLFLFCSLFLSLFFSSSVVVCLSFSRKLQQSTCLFLMKTFLFRPLQMECLKIQKITWALKHFFDTPKLTLPTEGQILFFNHFFPPPIFYAPLAFPCFRSPLFAFQSLSYRFFFSENTSQCANTFSNVIGTSTCPLYVSSSNLSPFLPQ